MLFIAIVAIKEHFFCFFLLCSSRSINYTTKYGGMKNEVEENELAFYSRSPITNRFI